MKNRAVILRLSYGYVAVIIWSGIDMVSKTEWKWNGNGAGMEEQGKAVEKKKCRKVTFLCVKICKCGNFFVTLCDNSTRALKCARKQARKRQYNQSSWTNIREASNQQTQNKQNTINKQFKQSKNYGKLQGIRSCEHP